MRTRRDPRAERQAKLVPGTARPRFLVGAAPAGFANAGAATGPTGRPRRDPRASRAAAVVRTAPRLRLDWTNKGQASLAIGTAQAAAAVKAAVRVIEEPAFLVLAVLDQPGGAPSDHDRQLIAGARLLADAGGGAVVAVTVEGVSGLGEAGADRLLALPADLAEGYEPERHAAAVLAAIETLKPRHVLFAESADGGADLARRVAAALGERLFAGVEALSPDRASRRARGGAAEMARAPARLMSVAADALPPHEGTVHEARTIPAPAFEAERRIGAVRPLAVDPDLIPLTETDFILSAGNGVTDWEGFAELARVLGATRGGSRVVCDEGHLPRERQVGASGSLVRAGCYVAYGIAGAPQHLQGITEVKRVVAINTDLHAEMIKRADLAIVADAQEVMPALIRHALERRAERQGKERRNA
ncbi:electron transfer flavoprotein subunit alpha/FixB family protein [Azospirillum sp. SYSU D00513]|uniref:electron transfer flavoprotein subunit alpha/FixB family protein n=1 Tax=Azospirillum sp. SYSU D00513 TaxID=2812561 RepID=UPI001A977D7C|nr:electron transfer flavoprotein subunit alpha/FixB family protein [Azospirillum sp. SYSU D00513]